MTALLVHTCTACDGKSPPSEAEPEGWQRFDDGSRLLCPRCSRLRQTQMGSHPMMRDPAFVARLGLVEAREVAVATTICAGCKEPFPA